MKSSLDSKLSGKQSSPVIGPTARAGAAMPYAHLLGLPGRVTEAVKAAPAKVQAVAAKALRKPATAATAPAPRIAKPAPAASKATAKTPKAARRQSPAMPFSEAMNGFKPTARDQLTGTTERWPEMVNGVATGRFIEVRRSKAAEPTKLDASAVARSIVAAGERARGTK